MDDICTLLRHTFIERHIMTIHSSPCTASRNLVKAIEVWELDEHRNELVWSSGTYGDLNELDQISRCTTFAHAEGLPGRVWASRSPVVMHDLSAGSFKRSDEATHAGIRCGLGIPCICGDQFRGVLVFLCDDEDELQARV